MLLKCIDEWKALFSSYTLLRLFIASGVDCRTVYLSLCFSLIRWTGAPNDDDDSGGSECGLQTLGSCFLSLTRVFKRGDYVIQEHFSSATRRHDSFSGCCLEHWRLPQVAVVFVYTSRIVRLYLLRFFELSLSMTAAPVNIGYVLEAETQAL